MEILTQPTPPAPPAPDLATLHEPLTREQRAVEPVIHLRMTRTYDWVKAEREDYEEYMREEEWKRWGCS